MNITKYSVLILVLISCTNPKQSKILDKDKITQEVIAMFDNYHDDIAKDGLKTEFKYLDESDDFFWVPPGYNSALTYDSVRNILIRNDRALKSSHFRWDTLQVFPLSAQLANYTGIVVGETVDTAGVIFEVAIIESGTVIKRAEGWKLLSGQSALLSPEAKTQVSD